MNRSLSESLNELAQDYSERVARLGSVAKATGWSDEASQYLRFEQLYAVIDTDQPYTVADLGSGYGAFRQSLPEQYLSNLVSYTGYDISDEMVKHGEKLFDTAPGVSFVCGSTVTQRVDYVVASGIFNHHFGAEPSQWQQHIHSTIEHMYAQAEKGIAFNIMSDQVDYREDYLHYQNPSQMLEFCLEKFGRNVQLIHHYPLFEFTVLIWKR